MSRVYFHSPTDTAELRGTERAYAGMVTDQIGFSTFFAVVGEKWINELIDPAHPLKSLGTNRATWREHLRREMTSHWLGDKPIIVRDGVPVDSWDLVLNTVLAAGTDALRLLARLHAQCEIHARVEGEHRAWLAGIIEAGRAERVLRQQVGWEEVAAMLRRRDDEPVVMSYSVCDQFPNRSASTWTSPSADGDEWYDLPNDEQWKHGMEWLRGEGGGSVLSPENWETYRFGHQLSAFDLLDEKWSARHTGQAGLRG